MFEAPTIWGIVPLLIFIFFAFRGWNPVAALLLAVIVGAVMSGEGLIGISSSIKDGLGSFLAYVGLMILSGAGLGKIIERTGAAQNLVKFIMIKLKVNSPTKAIFGTMLCSMLITGMLGTLAGANAVIAPVIIPIVAAVGVSSSVVAVIFQGAGTTGLFLGPFTPPMVTITELTGLSYKQVLFSASIPLTIIVWITTFIYCKVILKKSLKTNPYTEGDIVLIESDSEDGSISKRDKKIKAQSTFAFIATLLGLIIYGVIIEGGSTFAIGIILTTAVVTGLVGRLSPNEIASTFFEGAKPLIWLFFQFVLFSPFIYYIEKLGGFEAIANYLLPLVENGGNEMFLSLATILGVVGIPGASVAQMTVLQEMFADTITTLGIPMTVWVLALLVGSQMTEYLYPVGDTLGAMGIARSKDLKNMVTFGVVVTIAAVIMAVIMFMFV
ncbi:GntT/GntP/DsdX family permease [Virgibacillus necropolis]|uniref:Permease n=1 Tax=Virgibacillus necropolis TaxID=163877 RepID=A0A221MCJ7_9BACI|nr:Na+/H+ antiporter NhaC family protein [Virgibacillus necropolis]ASN05361.1 permease [Virgibacillus necropolis]